MISVDQLDTAKLCIQKNNLHSRHPNLGNTFAGPFDGQDFCTSIVRVIVCIVSTDRRQNHGSGDKDERTNPAYQSCRQVSKFSRRCSWIFDFGDDQSTREENKDGNKGLRDTSIAPLHDIHATEFLPAWRKQTCSSPPQLFAGIDCPLWT